LKKPNNITSRTILQRIRERYSEEELKERLFGKEPNYNELNISRRHLSADEWQRFKRDFVEEYGGEPVQSTGMTHSEFLHYIKTSGDRENEQYSRVRSLRKILEDMDNESP
jgi:nicotinamide mononucleotide adenylyltransferase